MRACFNCQKRKTRCIVPVAGRGPCSYCADNSKTCSFGHPPDRTRLTRQNLDASERKCAQLHSLLRSVDPNIDIDAALNQLQSDNPISPASDNDVPTPSQDMEADGMGIFSSDSGGYLGMPNNRIACFLLPAG